MTGEDDNGKTRLTSATVDWDATAPRSILFDDIYFSGDGEAETGHVFLAGNDLPARLSRALVFSVGELGFGTGLNFLKTWALWRESAKPDGARLRFFSVEGFPLATEDMARAHQAWPGLSHLSARLRAILPPPTPGLHRLDLDADVALTLFYGEAGEALRLCEGGIDAWFFDGFSPAKNPNMWRPELFEEAARLSNPGATFATYTVAGEVRRALAAAGFTAEKRPGFGAKKEMLAGQLAEASKAKSRRAPWFETARPLALSLGASIGIIGGGVAGASLAYAARRAGMAATIIDPKGLACGASGNLIGLVMPRLDRGGGAHARFFLAAYLYTIRLLSDLGEEAAPHSVSSRPEPPRNEGAESRDPPLLRLDQGKGGPASAQQHFVLQRVRDDTLSSGRENRRPLFNPCGALLGAGDDSEHLRQRKLLDAALLPPGWIIPTEDGLFFPQAGIVDGPRYVEALAEGAELVRARAAEILHDEERPRIRLDDGTKRGFDAVVIANGIEALKLLDARTLPLTAIAGQIDYFPDAPAPEHVLVFGAYAAPAPEGGLVIGATHEKWEADESPPASLAATRANVAALAAFAPELAAGLDPAAARPRAGLRCQTPDRLPVAGPLPDHGFFGGAYDDLRFGRQRAYPPGEMLPGTYILSGLGSRGLVTAPLAAAMIVAEMTGEPAPVDREVAEALHPARFFIRDLKRAQPIRKGRDG